MELRKYRWSRAYESAEEELIDFLLSKKIAATRWTGTADQEFAEHRHQDAKKLYCAEGSITFTVGEKAFPLQPGDALDIPAAMLHSAITGFSGCVCYEWFVPTVTAN